MLHHIDSNRLGPHGADMARAVSTCVHCGFCLPACPTYRALGEEMDSPRGRILLMKSALEGEIAFDDALPHVDRCLGCLACVTACPSGVQYGELLTPFRMRAETERRPRPLMDRLRRRALMSTLPYPGRFRLAAQAGRLARHVRALVPDAFRAMLDLVPSTLPPSRPLPALTPAVGARRARVALLAGCAQQVLAPEIGWAAVRVLARCGVEVVVPPDQGCCGAIAMHVGEEQVACALARRNLRAFPTDIDAIVTTTAGCGSGMKEYGLLFRGTSDEEAATRLAGRVRDVCELLDALDPPALADIPPLAREALPAVTADATRRDARGDARRQEASHVNASALVTPDDARQIVRVAYHDACHLAHGQGVREAPRALLRRIPNVTLVEIEDGGDCCGSAGTYNLDQPQIAGQLGQRKADAIRATGADLLASGNIGCLTQIRTHLRASDSRAGDLRASGRPMPALHTIELLDRALSSAHSDDDASPRG